jgi:CheY-like chemotaxis protein
VLVIDNDKATRDMLSILPHDEGGNAVIAADGPASALGVLHATPHRLAVLFDYHMPRMDGVALLALTGEEAWLRERHAFVCMTGASRDYLPPTLLALLAHFAVPLAAKPFHLDDMLAAIRQAEQRLAHHLARMRPPPKRKQYPRRETRHTTELGRRCSDGEPATRRYPRARRRTRVESLA